MSRKYAIIGDPVLHSLSPAMHNAGFDAVGLDAKYDPILLKTEELSRGVEYLQSNNYLGWNVTYPFKEQILPYLDSLTPAAAAIGSVNTVKADGSSLEGHNTDGEGFLLSLSTKGFTFSKKKAVVLGAGGAAKAIAVALAEQEAEILILNRSQDKARKLAEHILVLGGKASWGDFAFRDWLKWVDLLVQTTPVGMQGEDYFIDLKGINGSSWVIDLIYHPASTSFLRQAQLYGCLAMNGLEMLLYQGVLAWEYWLNMKAPVSAMRKALENG